MATTAATVAVKGIASAAVGVGMGIKTGMETNGSVGKKWAMGISTGVITGLSTFAGANIDAYIDMSGFATNVFTNSAATLFVGTPAEIVSVGTQQAINSAGKSSDSYYANPVLRSRVNFGLSQFV